MARWCGKDINYRGYLIKNDKVNKYLIVYDQRGNFMFRVENLSHGSITEVKNKIDALIERYNI